MSSEASAYVTPLIDCPDGAPLSCAHKCILFCLADHHNRSTRLCNPSQAVLVAESRTSKDTVQRSIDYLVRHGVLVVHRPVTNGRERYLSYTFVALEPRTAPPLKGDAPQDREHGAPFFPPMEREQKGSKQAKEREQKGSIDYIAIRKNRKPSTTVNLSTPPNGGALLKSWLAIKQDLRAKLPPQEWSLWVRPAYLLKVLSGGTALIALPPNGRIIHAARDHLPQLRELAAGRGFAGLNLTAYPDDYTRDQLAAQYPEFHAQMYGGTEKRQRAQERAP